MQKKARVLSDSSLSKSAPKGNIIFSVAAETKNARATFIVRAFRKAAATYSPTWWGSTIGASELNFSVRYGKRWILTAITTAVCYLREISRHLAEEKDIGLLVQVS